MKESENHNVPHQNLCVITDAFKDGQEIHCGGSFFHECILTIFEDELVPIRGAFLHYRQKLAFDRSISSQIFRKLLTQNQLSETMSRDVHAAWETIKEFNGGSLTATRESDAERTRTYIFADKYEHTVSLTHFEKKGIMACVEIATIFHDIFSHMPEYAATLIHSGVTYVSNDQAEDHAFSIVHDRTSSQYVLVDIACYLKTFHEDLQKEPIRIPFCSRLTTSQIALLENGMNMECDCLDTTRTYRIGTTSDPDGTWKSSLSI